MKISSQKQKIYVEGKAQTDLLNNKQTLPSVSSLERKKQSILDKYSFQDHEYSKVYDESISFQNQNSEVHWLELEIKEITTIGKQLITFFLSVKYELEYQVSAKNDEPNFKKTKYHQKNKLSTGHQIRQARSKLIHGSILQSQGKQLIINLKCKNLDNLMQKQPINNVLPTLKRIQFSLCRIFQNRKQGKIIAKQFINYPRTNQQYEIQFEEGLSINGQKSKPIAEMTFQIKQKISEEFDEVDDLSDEDQKSQNSVISQDLDHQSPRNHKMDNFTREIAKNKDTLSKNQPNSIKKEQLNVFDSNQDENESSSKYSQTKSQMEPHTVVKKLNELSRMIDTNLSRSKNQDAFHRSYLNETSSFLQDLKKNDNSRTQNASEMKESSLFQSQTLKFQKLHKYNQSDERYRTKQQPSDSNAERYNYISRFENTRLSQEDQKQYKNSPIMAHKYEKKSRNQKDEKSPVKDDQTTNPIQDHLQKMQKDERNLAKDANVNKKAVKPQARQPGQPTNQSYSRWIPNSLSQLDSSNIRYKYEQNDLSNIQQSKEVQGLINEIQMLEKEWYKRKFQDKKNNYLPENKSQSPKIQNQDKQKYIGIELKRFKFKFSEQNFYKRLFDGLKSKYNNCLDNKTPQSKIPKNYTVFLRAHQVEQNRVEQIVDPQSPKIEINIPSQQIAKLIQVEQLQKTQKAIVNPGQFSMSKVLQKQIIKDFQKQLHSKVMNIKVVKENQRRSKQQKEQKMKKIARIIQITLQEEIMPYTISKFLGGQNKINLIGMYPLPIFDEQDKQLQTSFYQNLSVEALSITMYNVKTGDQEGKLCFELKKGQQDKQIQTLEPLEDVSYEQLMKQMEIKKDGLKLSRDKNQHLNIPQDEQKQSSVQYVSKDHDSHTNQKAKLLRQQGRQDERSNTASQVYIQKKSSKQKNNKISTTQPFNFLNSQIDLDNKKGQNAAILKNNDSLRKQAIRSRVSDVASYRSQVIANFHTLKDRYADEKLLSNRKIQIQSKNTLYPQRDDNNLKVIKNSIKINNQVQKEQHLSSISKSKTILKTNKEQELVGRIIKNPLNMVQPNQNTSESHSKIKEFYVLPIFNMAFDHKQISRTKSKLGLSPQKSDLPNQSIFVSDSSHIRKRPNLQMEDENQRFSMIQGISSVTPKSKLSSYRMMKNQLEQTSNIISNLMVKTQQFIEKRQNQIKTEKNFPKTQTKNQNLHSQSRLMQQKYQDSLPDETAIKRASNLNVRSSVINETVFSRKSPINNSRNASKNRNYGQLQANQKPNMSQNQIMVKKQNPYDRFSQNNDERASPDKRQGKVYKHPLTYKQQSEYKYTDQKQKYQQQQRGRNVLSERKQAVQGERKYEPKNITPQKGYSHRIQQGNDSKPQRYRDQQEENSDQDQQFDSRYKQVFDTFQIKNPDRPIPPKTKYNEQRFLYNEKPSKLDSPLKNNPFSVSYYPQQRQTIQVNLCSVKIKLLSMSSVPRRIMNAEDKQYFILVYIASNQNNMQRSRQYLHLDTDIVSPVAQKCYKRDDSRENQLVAFFDKAQQNNLHRNSQQKKINFLQLKGFQTSKVFIQLYQIQKGKSIDEVYNEKIREQANRINLVTLSPEYRQKNKNQPIGSFSVTLLQLLAQQESNSVSQQTYEHKRQNSQTMADLINYTNFLYNKQNIIAKINLNYFTQSDGQINRNLRQKVRLFAHKQNKALKSNKNKTQNLYNRSESYDQRPNVNQLYLKNSLIRNHYHSKSRNLDDEMQSKKGRLRSESGMTKKVSLRAKNPTKKPKKFSDSEQKSANSTEFKRLDHLDILKRRIPKSLKKSEQSKNKAISLKYNVHLNRQYYTGKKKSSYASLNSSSSAKMRVNKESLIKNRESGYSSNNFQGEQAFNNLHTKSSKKIYEQEGQSPKKADNLKHKQLPLLRSKKQQKKLQKIDLYKRNSLIRPEPTSQTRISQSKRYNGGSIKFGKSSRFNSESDSIEVRRDLNNQKGVPGPGYYQIKSAFDRHAMKQP